MLSIALAFLLAFSENLPAKKHCGCVKAKSSETTLWGHQRITESEHKFCKQIRGVVLDADEGVIPEALVEVFTHPEHLFIKDYSESKKAAAKQQRIAACKAGINGKFCFSNLPAGKYELRVSFSAFNTTRVYVVLAPQNRRSSSRSIKVTLEIGQ